jgi:hypothetical protein
MFKMEVPVPHFKLRENTQYLCTPNQWLTIKSLVVDHCTCQVDVTSKGILNFKI